MKHLLFVLLFGVCTVAFAQQTEEMALEQWAKGLYVFAGKMPQEEVFVHMDNTGYYVGDTIFYKAYMRMSNGQPSQLSELLYVELLDNDGYLVERQNVRMTDGQGHGSFVLPDSLYGGYYELRAYTRWQLNWGRTNHKHSQKVGGWFYSKEMMEDFYRDYEKLYSRVFPVYDKPLKAGDYIQNMTVRPLERYFKQKAATEKAEVKLYPEGGSLVLGVTNRVAFEANDQNGQHLKGTLVIADTNGRTVASGETVDRGRGEVVFSPNAGTRYTASFKWDENKVQKVDIPEAESDGCSMRADVNGDSVNVHLSCAGLAAGRPLALTVMCHGVLRIFRQMGKGTDLKMQLDVKALPDGVAQLTAFDADGRVWADRLVFVRHGSFQPQNVLTTGIASETNPYQQVVMQVQGIPDATVSVAVRDKATSPLTFDGGNIMTELLLSSQIRGYVEQPDYYFESDDEVHRKALDLLLMVQGWRRYDWKTMSEPAAFVLNEPYEKTQHIGGEVKRYYEEGDIRMFPDPGVLMADADPNSTNYQEYCVSGPEYDPACEKYFSPGFVQKWHGLACAKAAAMILYYKLGRPDSSSAADGTYDSQIEELLVDEMLTEINNEHKPLTSIGKEVMVHADFELDRRLQKGQERGAAGETTTYDDGQFRIQAPSFDGYCRFFCSASDTTRWKSGQQHNWMDDAETGADGDGDGGLPNYPEFYVRFKEPYPRFVKPYSFYQTAEPAISTKGENGMIRSVYEVSVLDEVVIGAKRGGRRRFDSRYPALVLDAYDAFNASVDAGFNLGFYGNCARFMGEVAHTFVGDMNQDRSYNIIPRFNSLPMSHNLTALQLAKFDHLHFVDKVYIYTDYSPRREGDPHYEMENQPDVTVDLRTLKDGGQYKTYRDRYKLLWGFASPTEFYSPDYSRMPIPQSGDYRRTLYWNPDVKLDANGKATIQFYNNSTATILSFSANGMDDNGTLLSGSN